MMKNSKETLKRRKTDFKRLILFLLFDELYNHYCVHRYTFVKLNSEIKESL